jgi:chitodextrinase
VHTWVDTAFVEKVRYTYSLKAYDAAGNLSLITALRSLTPSQVPSTPILSIALSNGHPMVSWPPSTDNVGVTGYIIYRSGSGSIGSELARTSSPEWIDTTALPNKVWYYNVRAYDAAGNLSVRSALVSILAQ